MQATNMCKKILIIQGHPDSRSAHLGHALARAYAEGALVAGHHVEIIDVATLDFPLLRRPSDWEREAAPPSISDAQGAISRAEHIVFFYPLWMGSMPALLKGFLEQTFRPGFGAPGKGVARKSLAGRSARIVVTMGMPALVYRWYFFAHSLRTFKRNILALVGIAPVRETVIGNVQKLDQWARTRRIHELRRLGAAAV
jgi:putative NADPH-quinone reductase